MKIASRILSLLILVSIAAFYSSCGREEKKKKTEEETQLGKVKGVWTLVTANDGMDRTADFLDDGGNPMKLTLDGKYVEDGTYQYSFTGHRPDPSPWPVSGSWKFGTDKSTEIIRDPGTDSEVTMGYQVTENNLIFTFNVPEGSQGWPGGNSRTKSVSGDWTFTFSK